MGVFSPKKGPNLNIPMNFKNIKIKDGMEMQMDQMSDSMSQNKNAKDGGRRNSFSSNLSIPNQQAPTGNQNYYK